MELSTDIPLHPRQVSELKDERRQKERMLAAPEYIRRQLDSNGEQVARRIQAIDRVLEDQAAKPIPASEMDFAVKAEKHLREKITQGMPTQSEMRRNPAGAVDKHMAWEKRNKTDILVWKNIRRRLHASGVSDHGLQDENDVSNLEKFRPVNASHELNMHNEQIQGRQFHGLEHASGNTVVMTPEHSVVLKELNPALHEQMALLTDEQRAETLKLVDEIMDLRRREAAQEPRHKNKHEARKAGQKTKKDNYKNSEVGQLRARCKELGINCFGMSKDKMRQAIEDKVAQGD